MGGAAFKENQEVSEKEKPIKAYWDNGKLTVLTNNNKLKFEFKVDISNVEVGFMGSSGISKRRKNKLTHTLKTALNKISEETFGKPFNELDFNNNEVKEEFINALKDRMVPILNDILEREVSNFDTNFTLTITCNSVIGGGFLTRKKETLFKNAKFEVRPNNY